MDISSLLMTFIGSNTPAERVESKLPSSSPSNEVCNQTATSTSSDTCDDKVTMNECDNVPPRVNSDQENPTESISPSTHRNATHVGTIQLNSNIQNTMQQTHNVAERRYEHAAEHFPPTRNAAANLEPIGGDTISHNRGTGSRARTSQQSVSYAQPIGNREVEVVALPIGEGTSTKSLLKQLQSMSHRQAAHAAHIQDSSAPNTHTPNPVASPTRSPVPRSLRTLRKIAPDTYAVPDHTAEELTRQAVSLYRESVLSFPEDGSAEEPSTSDPSPRRDLNYQEETNVNAPWVQTPGVTPVPDVPLSSVQQGMAGPVRDTKAQLQTKAVGLAPSATMRKYTSFDAPMPTRAFPVPLPLSRVVEMLTIDATCAPACSSFSGSAHGRSGFGEAGASRLGTHFMEKPDFSPEMSRSVQGAGISSVEELSLQRESRRTHGEMADLLDSAYAHSRVAKTSLSPRSQVLNAPVAAVMGYVGRHSIDEDPDIDREERIRVIATPRGVRSSLSPSHLLFSANQMAGSRDLLASSYAASTRVSSTDDFLGHADAGSCTPTTPDSCGIGSRASSIDDNDSYGREHVLNQVRCTCPTCFPCSWCSYVPEERTYRCVASGHRASCIADDIMEHVHRPFPLSIDGIRYRGIVGSEVEIRRWDFAGITNISWEDEHGNVVQSRSDRKFDKARLADLIRHSEEKKSWFASKKKKVSLPKMRFLYPFPLAPQEDHDPELDYLIGDQYDLHDTHIGQNYLDSLDISTVTASSQEIDDERLLEQLLELSRPTTATATTSPTSRNRRDSFVSRSMKRMRAWWKRNRKTIAKIVVVVIVAGAIIGLSVISPLAGLFIAANAGFVAAAATTASIQHTEHHNEISALRISRLGVSQANSEIDQNLVANLSGGYIYAE